MLLVSSFDILSFFLYFPTIKMNYKGIKLRMIGSDNIRQSCLLFIVFLIIKTALYVFQKNPKYFHLMISDLGLGEKIMLITYAQTTIEEHKPN